MVINKSNGKMLFELTEDKFIIHRFFGNKIIERKDIKGAFLTEYQLYILTNDYKMIHVSTYKIPWAQREKRKELVRKISKENILISDSIQAWQILFLISAMMPLVGNILNKFSFLIQMTIFCAFLILFLLAILYLTRFRGVIYQEKSNSFQAVNLRGKVYKEFTNKDVELVKDTGAKVLYKLKNDKLKFGFNSYSIFPLDMKKAKTLINA